MSGKARGFTLVEMIVAIVVLGVGLAGVLSAFSSVVKSSADPMVQKQMLSIAEGMLEEIQVRPYATGTVTIVGCNREFADDIGDYNGYGAADGCGQPRDMAGVPIPTLSGYQVSVQLNAAASLGAISSDVTRITVTVTRGGNTLSLVGYRTNYAR